MKFLRYTYSALILMALLLAFGNCEDENSSGLSKAVLASASSLTFEGTGSSPQMITVYADADWLTEVPDWVTVSPTSGNGVTDVTISVTDNMRDGTLDNPRRGAVIFKGATLDSRAQVVVHQVGDKFRDVKDYTVGELAALADESVVSVPNVTVMALTTSGFIVTDAENAHNVYVLGDAAAVSIGDKVTLLGEKISNSQSLPIVDADNIDIVSTGGTVTYPTAEDITAEVDKYNATSREYIAVSGILNGTNVFVADANYTVSIIDAPTSLNLPALNGHRVVVKGYFDGLAAPVVKIFAAEIEDEGVVKVIYFSDDFEWMQPWAEASDAGQTVESNVDSKARNVYTFAALAGFVPDLTSRGYELICAPSTTTSTYLQKNYLKFGRTDVQAGIVLPPIDNIPENTTVRISFNWAPMVGGTRKFDPVEMVVLITNGDDEVELGPVGHSFVDEVSTLDWLHAEFEFNGVITEDTKITIRSKVWEASGFQRWFLDNIEISKVD